MTPKTLFLVLASAGFGFGCVHAASLTIDEATIDVGEQYQFSDIVRDVRIWNPSKAPVHLVDPSPSSKGGVRLTIDDTVLAPGKSTLLHVRVPLNDRSGKKVISVPFDATEEGKTENYRITFEVYVNSLLDDARPVLDLGVADAGTTAEKPVRLLSQAVPGLRVKRVLETPDFVSVRIGEDHQSVYVKPNKFDVLGIRSGYIKLALDSDLQTQAWITVTADMRGAVVPNQNPLTLDLQRPHTRRPVRLQLTGRDGKAVRIGTIAVDETVRAEVEPAPCLPEPRADCQAYLVTLKPDQPHGQILGKIAFELPDTQQRLEVKVSGMFLGDEAKVISLNDALQNASKQTTERKTDIAQALKNIVKENAEGPPPGNGPLLKWDVANEAGMFGYAIFRSEHENGPYTRVNPTIVRARNGGDNTSASYQWRDTSAVKGKEYWYYITMFNNDGHKQQLTGPQKVVVK